MKKITLLLTLLISSIGFSQELLTNGDFETGDTTGWIGNAANIVTEGGNSYNSANVAAAGNSFDVNLSQVLSITSGQTYTLRFDAWSDRDRTLIAGIGLNESPWTNTIETVNLTSSSQSYVLTLTANFGLANSRVLFDMGAAVGFVGIDNVSLQVLNPEDDARLSDLKIDGTSIVGFDAAKTTYEYEVASGGVVPTITATASNTNATVTITPATAIPGDTTIKVVSVNSSDTKTYTVSFITEVAPTNAPTTPPARNSWDVISLYGDAYGTATGLNGVSWDSGSEAVEGTYANNKALKIINGNGDFVGFEVANTEGFVDATNMTHVHVDFWVKGSYVTGQVLKIKLSNHNTAGSEINAIIKEIVPSATDVEKWISLDLPLATDAREKIAQIILIYTNSAVPPSVVYADNIYMYRAATASVDKNNLLNVSLSPSPAANDLRISAQATIENVTIYNVLGKTVLNAKINKKEDVINVSSLDTGVYILKYTINNAVGTMKFVKE